MKTVELSPCDSCDLSYCSCTQLSSMNRCEDSDHFWIDSISWWQTVLLMEPDMNDNSITDVKMNIPVFKSTGVHDSQWRL